jgi:hypothetical protein
MANPVKAGDAKPWVYAGGIQYDCQVAENEMFHLVFSSNPGRPGVAFFARQEARPSDKGKPGETRGRKVTGLHPLQSGYDRRTTEMG